MEEKRKYQITVELYPEDYKYLEELAENIHENVDYLIERFINDVTFGKESNGGDERELASDWYHRSFPGEFW